MEIIEEGFPDEVAERHVLMFQPLLSALRAEQGIGIQVTSAIQAGARVMFRFWFFDRDGFT